MESSFKVGGNVYWPASIENYWFLRKLKIVPENDPAILFWSMYSMDNVTLTLKDTHTIIQL